MRASVELSSPHSALVAWTAANLPWMAMGPMDEFVLPLIGSL